MNIPVVTLNNGVKMPVVGLGTWELKGEAVIPITKKALELGYTHIDTAEIYDNEEEIGKSIKNVPREKLFITSKVYPEQLDYFRVLGALEQSLARLQTPYLDQYLIHWPNKHFIMDEILKAFNQLYREGKIKSFGVSNFTINLLKEIIPIAKKLKLPITVNQVEFHPLLYQKKLLEFCKKNNILIVAYSPLARGYIFNNTTLIEIAKKYNKNAGQISLKWLIQKGIVVIPKASTIDHLQENLALFDFQLIKGDIDRIDAIKDQERLVNPRFAEFDEK